MWKSLWKSAEWAFEGYAKYAKDDRPFIIETLDRGPVVVLPPGQMKTVYKLPEERLDIFRTLNEVIQSRYTTRDYRAIHDPFHRHIIPSQLTRELDSFTTPLVTELAAGFESLWGTELDWREIPLWKACFGVVARVTNRSLCGVPLCRDENYLNLLQDQSASVFGGAILINSVPSFIKPFMGQLVRWWCSYYSRKVDKICIPYIEKRIYETTDITAKAGNDTEKDGLQLIIDETLSRGDPSLLDAKLISDRLLVTNNASVHSVTLTVHNLVMDLATSDPSMGYVEALREECREAFNSAGGVWTLNAVRKLKLVDSAIRESMRICPFGSVTMARTVMDPSGIEIKYGDSKVNLPRGTTVALPMEAIHFDEGIYPNAHRFDPFRFANLEKPATLTDDQFLGFGSSKSPCPGRFLAVHQMKLIMAHMLLNYDIDYTGKRPELTSLVGMKVPRTDIVVRVRRRVHQK
ncbi:cytochrome P450 [Hypoxylon rubiginosum]|uniref:Cytochrome P450 n=1 Tax=Hypoxylon rubiginosum TaxID=110542 RepID=A0ACC0CYE6_9PEZI|nr:cytochrome P450 [Hypoxylon rubiginosum]